MKHLTSCYILFLFSIFSFGQQSKIDSLNSKLNEINSNVKRGDRIKLIYKFCKSEIDKSNTQDYEKYINKLTKEAELQSNYKYVSLGYILLSDKYQRIGDLDKSISVIDKSIESLFHKMSDSLKIMSYTQKANVFKFFDKNDSSMHYFKKAIKIGETSKEYRPLGYSYNGISSLYLSLGDNIEAINFGHKSLEIAINNNFIQLKISNLVGLGWLYLKSENYEKSLEYLLRAKNDFDSEQVDNLELECDIYRFIGLNYSRKGDLDKAKTYNLKAKNCYKSSGNIMLSLDVLNTMGANYLRAGRFKDAIPYFEELIKSAQAINSKSIENFGIINLSSALIETNQLDKGEKILLKTLNDTIDKELLPKGLEKVVYQNLSDLFSRKKNYKSSLSYFKKFKSIEDSLTLENKLKEVAEIDTKYQTQLKEKENLQLKADNVKQELLTQKANTRNWVLALGILASLVSAFFIWRRYKSEAKAKQIISKQKTHIEKLQREFHHRIKNDFRSINSFIRLAQKKFPETEFQERLNELKNRVTSMFKVHELLLQQDDTTHVKAKPYFIELSENVKQKYDSTNIILDCNVNDAEVIVADKSVPFGVILNEFVTNSYKHAFDGNGGNISVSFHSDTYNHYLTLKDNGKGLPSDFDKNNLRSFGLEIMPLLAEQYDGEFKLESDNGVSVTVTLPKQIA
jgi:two-component sensor histidine kinase